MKKKSRVNFVKSEVPHLEVKMIEQLIEPHKINNFVEMLHALRMKVTIFADDFVIEPQ